MQEMEKKDNCFLPGSYNDNTMVLYPVDPQWLFASWEVSENRKNAFIDDFGSYLWEKSVPILKVTNITRNESFDIRVNDFSDNWYINVPYANCVYTAEIGRKVSGRFFINLVNSNSVYIPGEIASENTKILFADYKNISDISFFAEWDKNDIGCDFNLQLKDMTLPSSAEIPGMNLL